MITTIALIIAAVVGFVFGAYLCLGGFVLTFSPIGAEPKIGTCFLIAGIVLVIAAGYINPVHLILAVHQ